MRQRIEVVARDVLRSALLLAVSTVLGFILLVALFKLGIGSGIEILFYRGVALSGIALVLTVALVAVFGGRLARVSVSEALAAGALSLGLNLSFLVIAPVTVDRSISVFLLAHMARNADTALTTADLEQAFRGIYVGELAQIDRRMKEQVQSGNVVGKDGGFVLTPQGEAFVLSARAIGAMFDADPRLMDPQARKSGTTAAAAQAR